MANVVDIVLKGVDQASGAINGVNSSLDKLSTGGTRATSALKLLGGIAGSAMFLKLAGDAMSAVMALDKMREESEQIGATFLAQAGSTRAAMDALSAMNATLGNAITNDEKMAASGQLMALGLAQSAQGAADLANMAVSLGDKTQSAANRIEGLTQIMVSGRLVGLKNYGVSMQDVTARAAELQATTSGLTDIEATRTAIVEALTVKLDAYNAAGGEAVTVTQGLANAWADYQDALANSVKLSGIKGEISSFVNEATARLQMGSGDPVEQLTGLESRLRQLSDLQNGLNAKPIHLMANANQAEIDSLIQQIAYLKQSMAESGDVGAGAATRIAAGLNSVDTEATAAATELELVNAAMDNLESKEKATQVNAVAMAILAGKISEAKVEALGLAAAYALISAVAPAGPRGAGYAAYDAGRKAGANVRDADVEAYRIAQANEKALTAANTAVAKDYTTKMSAAGQAAASKIQGYLSEGINFSKGLDDLTGGQGGLAPGKNGAFEDIYRLQAWLNDGSWGDVGQKFAGGDKEKGRKIIEDFQNGIFSADVIGAIDVDALAGQAGMAALAAKSQEAFAQAIANKAGTSTSVVDTLLGFKADDKGVKPSDTAAENAMAALASSVEAQVKGKDFAGKMIGYGETIWGYTEAGMIGKAKTSTAFQAAIDAMVNAAIAAALGGP